MDKLEIRNNLTEFESQLKTVKTYPFILMKNPIDELSVLFGGLPKGDLPLVIPAKGRLIKIRSIERHPVTLDRILRIRPFILVLSEDESYDIHNITELLDLEEFKWT